MIDGKSTIAEKHVEICFTVMRIVHRIFPRLDAYVATHAVRKLRPQYAPIELKSGKEFWSIKVWSATNPRELLKEPDIAFTYGNHVEVLFEIKWGADKNRPTTDLRLRREEREKIMRMRSAPAECNISGPVVKDGNRFYSPFSHKMTHQTDHYTKLILISDFSSLNMSNLDLEKLLNQWKDAKMNCLIADIGNGFGTIPSLQQILEG